MQKLIDNNKHYSLTPKARKKTISALNQTMAELSDLLASIKQAHRNARGTTVHGLDYFAGRIMGHIDHVAERAMAIGAKPGRFKYSDPEFSTLTPPTAMLDESQAPVADLASLHYTATCNVRTAVRNLVKAQDFGSADVLADVLRTLHVHFPLLHSENPRRNIMMN